jgi:hypothetical protein
MRASSLIDVLQAVGCTIALDENRTTLTLAGDEPPPAPLLQLLHEHKPAIVRELQSPATWTAADWRWHFHERAAVLEHDAGLPRAAAEEEALQMCFQQWCGRKCG